MSGCHTSRLARAALAACAALVSLRCGSTPIAPPPPPPPPTLTIACPAAIDVESPDGQPVEVSYAPPQTGGGTPPVTTTCTAPSGAFPVGSNQVTCQATDSRGQTASCGFVIAVRPPPRLRFTQFLSFGDSLTAGEVSTSPTLLFLSPNDSYPAVLQRRLTTRYRLQGPVVINDGVPGETASVGGHLRFRAALSFYRPQVALLMEGTNDLLAGEPGADAALAALRQMVQEAKGRGIQVGLATIPPQRAGGLRGRDRVAAMIPGFNDRIRALAAAEAVVLIDVYAAMKDDLSLIGVDDLHPTIRGYDVMGGVFFDAVRAAFEERPPAPAAGVR